MPKNRLALFSALWSSAVETAKLYVPWVQILANSIELRTWPPRQQSAGDTANCLQIISTPTTRSYHRQISLRSCPRFQTTNPADTQACVLVTTDRQTNTSQKGRTATCRHSSRRRQFSALNGGE
jgi:hypothetical protein